MILAIDRVLPVDDECRLFWDCGRHEDDTACSFAEFLGGVDELVVALYAALAAVCSARVVNGLELVGAFVDIAVWVVGPSEEDYLSRGAKWGKHRRVKTVDGEAEGGAFGKDGKAAVGSNRLGIYNDSVSGDFYVVKFHTVKELVNVVNLAVAIAGGKRPCGAG